MSTQDDINISDEEFDAFLKGEGELALMLRQMPQVQPSAQLDDAILNAVKVELAQAPVTVVTPVAEPSRAAANDPVMPNAKPSRSFSRRWKVPLGLAASLLVTVQLVRMEVRDEQSQPGMPALLVEKAPAPPEIRQPVESRILREQPPVSVKIVPPPGYEPPESIAAPAAPVPATPEAIEAAQATAAAVSRQQEKRKAAPSPLPLPELSVAAPKPAPLPMADATPALAALAPSVPPMPAPVAPAPFGFASAPSVSARAVAPVDVVPAPAAAPLPAPARAARANATSAPDASNTEQQVQRVEITGSNVRRADAETASPVQVITSADMKASGMTSVADAQAQLAHIENLLKAGSDLEALAAWRKFRRSYPEYKVPEDVRVKMDAWLNEQTLDSGP